MSKINFNAMKKWQDGMAIDGTYLNIRVPLISHIIEFTKKDKNGNDKLCKVDRLATLLGSNGFGSYILGTEKATGKLITIQLKVNRVNPNNQEDLANSDFDMGN